MCKVAINTNPSIDFHSFLEERKKIAKYSEEYWDLKKKEKYPDNYVFDEEKSVRWNKEEVIRLNNELDKDREKAREAYSNAEMEWLKSIYETVMKSYGFSYEMVVKTWDMAYEESHSCGYGDVLTTFDELLDYALDMIRMANKE